MPKLLILVGMNTQAQLQTSLAAGGSNGARAICLVPAKSSAAAFCSNTSLAASNARISAFSDFVGKHSLADLLGCQPLQLELQQARIPLRLFICAFLLHLPKRAAANNRCEAGASTHMLAALEIPNHKYVHIYVFIYTAPYGYTHCTASNRGRRRGLDKLD